MSEKVAYVPCNNREEEVEDASGKELERVIEDADPGEKICDKSINQSII